MLEKQRTIKREVSISGIGLHTGCKVNMIFKPAAEDHGIVFRRNLEDGYIDIPALIDYVDSIARGTILSKNGVKIHTVEHVLAAVAGLCIDNIRIEIDAEEPPVMDGSSIEFVKILENNIEEQNKPRQYFELKKNIEYKESKTGIELIAVPSDKFKITYMVDYHNPALGTQFTSMYDLQEEFVKDYAATRTFCFLSEVEKLQEIGLIKGGNLDNSVVILDRELSSEEKRMIEKKFGLENGMVPENKGVLGSVEFRFPNEPVRHKTLDLIGDLALLGKPLKAHMLCARGGHASHIGLVRNLKKAIDDADLISKYKTGNNDNYVFDVQDIKKLLPHRYPFLLVDRITDIMPGERVTGIKNVTINEEFFKGHFPGKPVMPGVLIVEAMGQVGGTLLMNSIANPKDKVVYFTGLDKIKYRRTVIPGDQLVMQVEMVRKPQRNICKMQGTAYVEGKKVAEALMTAMIIDKNGDK